MQVIISGAEATAVQVRGATDPDALAVLPSTFGNPEASRDATEADVAHLSDVAWMRGMQTSAVMDHLSSAAPSPELASAAFAALCSGAPDRLVMRRDTVDGLRRTSVQTLAWAGAGRDAHYGLVDLTLDGGAGASTLGTQDTGIYWTRHAVARRYERTGHRGSMGVVMARELAPHRTLLRLVVREAARLDLHHVPVPLARGMLLGTLRTYDWVPTCGSVRVGSEGGRLVATAVDGSCVAADGHRWTGVTFVTGGQMRPDQSCYGRLWRELLSDGAVIAASRVFARNDVPDAAGLDVVAGSEAALQGRIRTLLLMAVRGHGREIAQGN